MINLTRRVTATAAATASWRAEFDKGRNDLAGRVVPKASGFGYLGANVYDKGTTTVAAPLEEYAVLEKAGLKIAVVGVVTSDLPSLVSPAGIADLTIGNPVEAINRVTDELLDGDAANGEAHVVLASLHEGAALASQTAEANAASSAAFDEIYRDIDPRVTAIFNAHTHQRYTFDTTDGRPIVQAGSYASHLAKLDLVVDTTAKGVCSATDTTVAAAATSDESLPAIKAINDIARAAYDVAMVEGAQACRPPATEHTARGPHHPRATPPAGHTTRGLRSEERSDEPRSLRNAS